jgi:hypothetical protein
MSSIKKGGSGCGCSSGGMSGGSGYGLSVKSAPMALGPYSGYGAIDPYAPGITTGSGFRSSLAYPPLTKFIGGKSRRSSKRSSKRSSRGGSRKKASSKSKSRKLRSRSSRFRRSKSRRSVSRRQRGGDLSFSDYVPSAANAAAPSSPSVGQVASSPTYGVDLKPLGPNLSALANPVVPQVKNTCK